MASVYCSVRHHFALIDVKSYLLNWLLLISWMMVPSLLSSTNNDEYLHVEQMLLALWSELNLV